MRLQLDATPTGPESTKSGGIGQSPALGGTGSESGRIGSNAAGTQDSIQISGPSSALNRLATDRVARIAQLTAAVQGGSYQVSASKISNAIVGQATS
jgi:anti-sigma28 factor (negative regulator of flagellin synthesis)